MEVRLLEKSENEQALYVWSQAFERGNRELKDWMQWEHNEKSYLCGVWDEAGLQATVLVLDYNIHLGPEAVVPMGGIGNVASLPASRGKGYAGAGLKFSLERMRETGHVTSMLYPFSFDYYKRFGWEWVGTRRIYSVETRSLKPTPETENVHAATLADRPAITQLYDRFARRYRGAVQRTDAIWAELLDDKSDKYTSTYLYEKDGQAEGYLTYRGGEEKETWLREFVSLTPRAQAGLIGLLRRMEMQVEKFTWNAPQDDLLWLRGYHWDIKTRLEPVTQGRVVDVVGALEGWKYERHARDVVILAVLDECAPWNTGTWRVEFEGKDVSVRPTTESPHVSLDIQALSQAYFGAPTVDELRAADRLAVHDEAGYAALKTLFAGPPMWINDDF